MPKFLDPDKPANRRKAPYIAEQSRWDRFKVLANVAACCAFATLPGNLAAFDTLIAYVATLPKTIEISADMPGAGTAPENNANPSDWEEVKSFLPIFGKGEHDSTAGGDEAATTSQKLTTEASALWANLPGDVDALTPLMGGVLFRVSLCPGSPVTKSCSLAQ